MTINRVQLQPVTAGYALDHLIGFFGPHSDEAIKLAPQIAAARNLRVLNMNGCAIAVGGVVPLNDGTSEGFLIIDPHWTPTPRLMVLAVRRIRAAVEAVSRHHDLIVHVRSRAGKRLARTVHLTQLRMIRLHDVELEVWGRVVPCSIVHPAQVEGAEGAGG
jgi:hypothetical protein